MSAFYDDLETRSAEARAADLARDLPAQIARAQALSGYAGRIENVAAGEVTGMSALARLPVLRKSDLGAAQKASAPLGGLTSKDARAFAHVFQSPGPIYEPGDTTQDWWRVG